MRSWGLFYYAGKEKTYAETPLLANLTIYRKKGKQILKRKEGIE